MSMTRDEAGDALREAVIVYSIVLEDLRPEHVARATKCRDTLAAWLADMERRDAKPKGKK